MINVMHFLMNRVILLATNLWLVVLAITQKRPKQQKLYFYKQSNQQSPAIEQTFTLLFLILLFFSSYSVSYWFISLINIFHILIKIQMNNTKFCQINGHEMNSAIHICTFKDCESTIKWVCFECTFKLHQHGGLHQNNIMNKQQFLQIPIKQLQSKGEYINQQISLLAQKIKIMDQFVQNMVVLKQQLEQDIKTLRNQQNTSDIENLVEIAKSDYLQLDNQQLNQIMNIINDMKLQDLSTSSELVFQLQEQSKQLEQLFKVTNDDNYYQEPYNIYLEYKSKDIILTSQISYDEKYLIIGDFNKLQVFHLESQFKIRSIELDYYANICQFTNNSKYLFCGDSQGYLCCFDCNQDFKQVYKSKIHQDCINQIKFIDNLQIITCSRDKSILITNLKKCKQELSITYPGFVQDVDYDFQKNVIISCSYSNAISFYNKNNGQIIFQQQEAHTDHILKIQLSQNNSLISSDFQQLVLWHIDYDQQKLIKIKEIELENFNFTAIYNQNKVLLIHPQFIQILDNDLNLLDQIDHNIQSRYDDSFYIFFNLIIIFDELYNNSRKIKNSNYEVKLKQIYTCEGQILIFILLHLIKLKNYNIIEFIYFLI
ncbi:DDB1- and CUL4-associated factor 10 [Paramecium bursaria]